MTEVISRNEFDKSYLLVKRTSREEKYVFKMLTQNSIPGIPNCKIRYLDEDIYLAYDVTGKKILEKAYDDRKMGFEDLMELFYGIRDIIHSANRFLLDGEGFMLIPRYMFRDMETGELSCLYHLPEENVKEERYRFLADFLLDRIDHKDEHAVNIAYHFYKLSKEEYFSFDSFIGFMEKESLLVQAQSRKKEETKEEMNVRTDENDLLVEDDFSEYAKRESFNRRKLWLCVAIFLLGSILTIGCLIVPGLQKNALYFLVSGITLIVVSAVLTVRSIAGWYLDKERTLYEEPKEPVRVEDYFDEVADDVTVFFDSDEYVTLKWKEGHFSKEYCMEEFPITVGKMQGSVQIHINDASVSRLHARFRKKDNTIYLQDLDSTNGTYVNEKQLCIGEERIIKRGDEIQFGKIIVNVV